MWGETKQATSATTSLIYITLGALIDVWTVVYWFYLRGHGGTDTAYLYVAGFFFTGIVLLFIGLAVGRIGNAARPAEVAPVPTSQVITPGVVTSNQPQIGISDGATAAAVVQPATTYQSRTGPSASGVGSVTSAQSIPNT